MANEQPGDYVPLRAGDTLYGFCAGAFGRDSYEDKIVQAIGRDWVVVRDTTGLVSLFTGDPESLRQFRTPAQNEN